MAGQQNFRELSQENYFDKFEDDLLRQADLYYLNKKFGIGQDVDKDKLRHSQMFYNILCTDECELIDWVSKKINGDLEGVKYRSKLEDFKIYDEPYGCDDSCNLTSCCNWAEIQW